MLIFGGRRANIDHIFLKRKPKVHQCDLEFLASWAVDCKYCKPLFSFSKYNWSVSMQSIIISKHYYTYFLMDWGIAVQIKQIGWA